MGQHAFSIPRLIENKGLLSIWFRFQASLEIKYYFPLKTHFKYIYTDFDALHFLKKNTNKANFWLIQREGEKQPPVFKCYRLGSSWQGELALTDS